MKELESIVQTFFQHCGITIASLNIGLQAPGIYTLHIETPDSDIIIGAHAKNMSCIAFILGLLFSQQLKQRTKLYFDINDYSAKKQEKFVTFIESQIDSVIRSGNDLKLPYMDAYDRKKIHSYISEKHSGHIFTKSIGEEKDRRLFICKKSDMSASIDINGTDI